MKIQVFHFIKFENICWNLVHLLSLIKWKEKASMQNKNRTKIIVYSDAFILDTDLNYWWIPSSKWAFFITYMSVLLFFYIRSHSTFHYVRFWDLHLGIKVNPYARQSDNFQSSCINFGMRVSAFIVIIFIPLFDVNWIEKAQNILFWNKNGIHHLEKG